MDIDTPNREKDIKCSKDLKDYLEGQDLYETMEQRRHRESVLESLKMLLNNWAKSVIKRTYPDHDQAPNEDIVIIYTYGSFALGVHSPDGDIDVLCIGPKAVDAEVFYEDFPDQLMKVNSENEEVVKDLNVVKTARTPIVSFTFRGIDIDLEYISLQHFDFAVPLTFDIRQDYNLKGVSSDVVRAMNGRRVAEIVLDRIKKDNIDREQFEVAIKALKLWTKKRGLNENTLGYFGGVNVVLLMTRICQENPTVNAAELMRQFFVRYSSWKWPEPVYLLHTPPKQISDFDEVVWSKDRECNDLFPVITPAYPSMNSCASVSEGSKRIILQEMERGKEITDQIFEGSQTWSTLFEDSTFFEDYKHYLMVTIASKEHQQQVEWKGLCRSRIKKSLVNQLENHPNVTPRIFPKSFDFPENYNTEYPYGCCYFIGLSLSDIEHIPDRKLDLRREIKGLVDNLEEKRKEGSMIRITHLKHTKHNCELPSFVYQPKSTTTGVKRQLDQPEDKRQKVDGSN